MKGQVWVEILIVVAGLFLGSVLSVGPLLEHLTKNVAVYLPKVALAKAYTDTRTLLPHEITSLSIENKSLLLKVYPDDGLVEGYLSSWGVNTR